MKIMTLTCHNVYNYGATLQAYALQYFLESNGHNVEIINYSPKYHSGSCWNIPENSSVYKWTSKYFLIHCLYACHRYIKYLRDTNFRRRKEFDKFDIEYLHLTATKYCSYKELFTNPPIADMYVAGSDQIWNPIGGTGLDPAFYLQFGNKSVKRISYAASFGISELKSEVVKTIIPFLAKLNSISVREFTGVKILKNIGFLNSVQVVDPVFLLSKQQWLNFIKEEKIEQTKYILIYDFFQDDNNIKQMASLIKRKFGYSIISVNDHGYLSYADRNISDASPKMFLALIRDAQFVLSNSFHATAFSVIFNKEFYVYPVQRHINQSRMIDLLSGLDILCRYNSHMLLQNIDWNVLWERLSQKISFSKQYLEENLASCLVEGC